MGGAGIAVPLALPFDTVDRPARDRRARRACREQTVDDAEEGRVADLPQSNTTTPRATSPAIMRLKPSLMSWSLYVRLISPSMFSRFSM